MVSDAVLYVALVAAPAAGILGCLAGGCLIYLVMRERDGGAAAESDTHPFTERVKSPPRGPATAGTTAPIPPRPPDADPRPRRTPPELRA